MLFTVGEYFEKLFNRSKEVLAQIQYLGGAVQNPPQTHDDAIKLLISHQNDIKYAINQLNVRLEETNAVLNMFSKKNDGVCATQNVGTATGILQDVRGQYAEFIWG